MFIYTGDQKGSLLLDGFLDPDDVDPLIFWWGAPVFEADKVYRLGDLCRPTIDNGYYYVCSTNGRSGVEPVTWGQASQQSGTATFEAVPWDLWLLPNETLQGDVIPASEITATDGVTLSNAAHNGYSTSVFVSGIPPTLKFIEVKNRVRKNTGAVLSRTVKIKVNQQ
jgi:hypothetical protein